MGEFILKERIGYVGFGCPPGEDVYLMKGPPFCLNDLFAVQSGLLLLAANLSLGRLDDWT